MSPPSSQASRLATLGRRRLGDLDGLAVAAIAIPALSLLVRLGSYGLLNNNEGLYAEIAREMAEGGSWIIPHLNGVPYIEKPPLFYWLMALLLAHENAPEFLLRTVPAAAGALALGCTWWFAARVASRRTALLATLVLGTCIGFLAMSRVVMLDMLLTALLIAALYGGYFVLQGGASRAIATWTGCALALAVLAKGWIAVLLFALVFAIYLATLGKPDRSDSLRRLGRPAIWITFSLVALPWHVAAALSLREFAWFYFINEHVLRFLGLREPHDYYGGPIWYYLPRLAFALLPWTFLLFVRRSRATRGELPPHAQRFLWIAALVPLALLSMSSAKANYYAILCVPPIAILIACNIAVLVREQRARGFALRCAAAAIALLVVVLAFLGEMPPARDTWPIAWAAAAVVVAGIAAPAIAARLASTHRWAAACIAMAAMAVPITWFAVTELEAWEPALSPRPWLVLHEDLARLHPYVFADFESFSALPFYVRAPVQIIDSRSRDLAFAQRHGYGGDVFVRSQDIAREARGLVWYERRRQQKLEATRLGPRLSFLGCAGEQCVAQLAPAKD